MRYLLLIGFLFMGSLITSCDDDDSGSSSNDPDPQELEEYFRANVNGTQSSFPEVSFRENSGSADGYRLVGQELFARSIIIDIDGNSPGTYELDPESTRIRAEYQHVSNERFLRGLLGTRITLDDDAPAGYVKGSFYLRMTEDFEITDGEFLAKVQ